ncbi:MAG: fimbrillin family protein [Bacteroidaceae bacterium]|nr:fimbrillin family protein [Bacteroidaceae bacterium]
MKEITNSLSFLLGMSLFVSCNNTDMESEMYSEVEVRLSSQILTRVSNDQWEANDEIGIFMYEYGTQLSDASVYDKAANSKYITTTTGELSPATKLDKMYYPLTENVNFIAYYPFGYTDGYSIDLNVTHQNDPAAIDFLYSNNLENVSATSSVQNLNFTHQLSKIVFDIKAGYGINAEELEGLTVTMHDVVTKATFSLIDGSITPNTQKQNITIPTRTSENGICAEGIVIPQECNNVFFTISLTSGKTFFFTIKDNNHWISGHQYTYEVLLTNHTMEATLSATISKWADGVVGDIEDVTSSQMWDGTSVNTNWYTDETTTYTLYRPADLAGLAQLVNEGNSMEGKTIYLSAELDMNNKPWTPIGISDTKSFKGTFIGNNYQIKNLNPVITGNVNTAGLFAISEGVIQQVQVDGIFDIEYTKSSIYYYLGSICGINKGTIMQCRSNVNMNADIKYKTNNQTIGYIGGIVGDNTGAIHTCQNYGTISAENINTNANAYLHIGGIAGSASNGATISNCENMRKLTGSNGNVRMGGIVAIASGESVSVTGCTNFGEILIEKSNNEAAAGGIVGRNATKSTVKEVYNKGLVNITLTSGAKAYAGGLIGINDAGILLSGENSGNITVTGSAEDDSASAAGGIVGYNINAASVHMSTNKGTASANNAEYCFSGGITGFNSTKTDELAYTYDCCSNTGYPSTWVGNSTEANNLITNTEHTDE